LIKAMIRAGHVARMRKKYKCVQGLELENQKERVRMLHISIYGNIRLTF
jgi:hypothetical protein